jgi:hypothetical protein
MITTIPPDPAIQEQEQRAQRGGAIPIAPALQGEIDRAIADLKALWRATLAAHGHAKAGPRYYGHLDPHEMTAIAQEVAIDRDLVRADHAIDRYLRELAPREEVILRGLVGRGGPRIAKRQLAVELTLTEKRVAQLGTGACKKVLEMSTHSQYRTQIVQFATDVCNALKMRKWPFW